MCSTTRLTCNGLALILWLLSAFAWTEALGGKLCLGWEYPDSGSYWAGKDFDGDGVKDMGVLGVRGAIYYTSECGTWPYRSFTNTFRLSGGEYGEILVDSDSGLPVFNEPGALIGPGTPARAAWRNSTSLLIQSLYEPWNEPTNAIVWQIGPMLSQDSLWAGVRFRTPAGTNYGWVKLATLIGEGGIKVPQMATNSFNPLPDAPIAIGEVLPPAPVDENDWVTNQPITLFRSLDLVLETRRRLADSGQERIDLTLRAIAPVLVLARDGMTQTEGTVEASPLPYHRRVPRIPSSPQRWTEFHRVPLLSTLRDFDAATGAAITNKSGLLAQGPQVIGVMITNGDQVARVFPLYFDGDGRLIKVARGQQPFPVVGAELADTAVDLNQDGLIDYILFDFPENATPFGMPPETLWTASIVGLGGNSVLLEDFTQGPTLPTRLDANTEITINKWPNRGAGAWTPGPRSEWDVSGFLRYTQSWSGPWAVNDWSFVTNSSGFIGVRFSAPDGIHLGWLKVRRDSLSFSVVDYSYNPAPGQPILVGQHLAAPLNTLRVSRPSNGKLVVEGEVVGRHVEILRALDLGSTPAWKVHFSTWGLDEEVGENRYRFQFQEADSPTKAFYRLWLEE